jgi:hypothetical protein
METDLHDVIRAIEQAVEEKRERHSVVAWVRSETRDRGLVGVSGEMIRADRWISRPTQVGRCSSRIVDRSAACPPAGVGLPEPPAPTCRSGRSDPPAGRVVELRRRHLEDVTVLGWRRRTQRRRGWPLARAAAVRRTLGASAAPHAGRDCSSSR